MEGTLAQLIFENALRQQQYGIDPYAPQPNSLYTPQPVHHNNALSHGIGSFPLWGGQLGLDVDIDIMKGLKGFKGATLNWERKF